MLREIVAARQNNQASHQLSNSALSIERNPPKSKPLTELNQFQQPDTDRRNAGIDTSGPSSSDVYKVNMQA
ncbi:MAG TPA: hypothetical protein PKX74_14295 [Leptospiraceae bacterium]|nr:hypothetical protein [Leptospiraceae bacterium]HMY46645.1 hypothetical protein [Leptospiraceae bacterium]HNJ36296.1 hypothetical protein [Leptospiraceae bacterium]HNL70253.1 hypothetical protein [Leptospiraceae bacterium]HNN60702.1 hypothetical protein [Leptospiraceae bacterium]